MKPNSVKTGLKKVFSRVLGEKLTDNLITMVKGKKRFFESEEVLSKRISFYKDFLKKGDLVFDIGSNMGNRIRPLLSLELKVVAIEPQMDCFQYLQRTFGNQISLEQKGVGSKEEKKKMFISKSQNYLSSFSEDWIAKMKEQRFQDATWDNVLEVEITTLDNLIRKYGVPKFIKIDVEGYELEVLNGLNSSIELISFEYAVPENLEGLLKCLNRLSEINDNYRCNYSIGESMELAMSEWKSIPQMRELVQTEKFIQASFGDIYVSLGQKTR